MPRRSRVELPEFERATPAFHAPRAPRDTLTATWIGHSTVLVQMAGLNIVTDPMWSERASPFRALGPRRTVPPGATLESLPPLDLVLLSHNHYDHLDDRTVRRLAASHPDAHWLAPLGVAAFLARPAVPHVDEHDGSREIPIADARIT
jgi:N-acyl-phosphatidylethanolamine-hydrolysing phospholipase D